MTPRSLHRANVLATAVACLMSLCLLSPDTNAQANADPSIDVRLGILGNLNAVGRGGVFPNGTNAAAMATTVCNEGGLVPWMAPMDAAHPTIAFLMARLSDDRFVQISNRSHVKHGFFALTSSQCTPCTPPPMGNGDYLGVGCSDTYSINNNGNDFWLGPADEIDPWLGAWDPVCSFFDLGTGAVTVPDDCDGARSFSQSQANALGPIGNRMEVGDEDLNVPGATFWYQGHYVVATEPEAEREDNLSSRAFVPVWNGSTWNLNETGPQLDGTILQRWEGASITSNTNGADDGRVYVASKTSGPAQGFHHFEYALHNRDNARGVSELRLPLCAGTRVRNAGFRDIDDDPTNDWVMSIESAGTELVFRDPSGTNPLRWNTIYNVWFDADASAGSAGATLVQAAPGAGAGSFGVSTDVPIGLYNVFAGAGCSNGAAAPSLFATGSPARATLGNPSFALVSEGNVPGESHLLITTDDFGAGAIPIGSCTFWLPGPLSNIYTLSTATSDGSGTATHLLPVPNSVAYEGLTLSFQAIGLHPGSGAAFGVADFSDALMVRVGDGIGGCE